MANVAVIYYSSICAHLDATADVPQTTRYGNRSSQLKQLLDATAPLRAAG